MDAKDHQSIIRLKKNEHKRLQILLKDKEYSLRSFLIDWDLVQSCTNLSIK
jgi:hypothetical protein